MAEKRLQVKDLRNVPDSELSERLGKLQQELWQYRIKAKEGSLQQTHMLRATKRDLARIRTVLQEQRHTSAAATPSTPRRPRPKTQGTQA